jgi:hypothetical protein
MKPLIQDIVLLIVQQQHYKTSDPRLIQCTAQSVGRQVPAVTRNSGTWTAVSAFNFAERNIRQPSRVRGYSHRAQQAQHAWTTKPRSRLGRCWCP